ncbi:MAG: dehydratase [Alphaproteobacteria bacterium]|nr:MAG: dehydratase [Alphaproteobacteria bacterium]
MAKVRIHIKDIKHYTGRRIGTSKWVEITQSRVNKFAEATGDFQWIHMDQERAGTELPSGRTIVHNFLLLSLVPQLFDQIVTFSGLCYGQNRGAENMRFLRPLPTGSRVRIQVTLSKLENSDQKGQTATFQIVMEKEDSDKPVLTLDLLLYFVAAQRVTSLDILSDQHQSVAL